MKRNYAIDLLRGIVTISIIFIHTVWWSGQAYIGPVISNLALLIDVPAFMFIAGLSFGYSNSIIKNIKNIIIQWKKYLFFIVIYSLILIIFFKGEFVLTDVLKWIVYIFPSYNSLAVVGGSLWFMPMYISVTLFCSIIICTINKFSAADAKNNIRLVFFLFIFMYFYTFNSNILFIDSRLIFYSIIYFLGYFANKNPIKSWKHLLIFGIIDIGLVLFWHRFFNFNLVDIQNIKFAQGIPYMLVSLFSIMAIWYLKDRLKIRKSNLLAKLGANSIFFYFSQGISSSLLYIILNHVSISNKYLCLLFMFFCNLVMAIIIGTIFCVVYKSLEKFISKVMQRKNETSIVE